MGSGKAPPGTEHICTRARSDVVAEDPCRNSMRFFSPQLGGTTQRCDPDRSSGRRLGFGAGPAHGRAPARLALPVVAGPARRSRDVLASGQECGSEQHPRFTCQSPCPTRASVAVRFARAQDTSPACGACETPDTAPSTSAAHGCGCPVLRGGTPASRRSTTPLHWAWPRTRPDPHVMWSDAAGCRAGEPLLQRPIAKPTWFRHMR